MVEIFIRCASEVKSNITLGKLVKAALNNKGQPSLKKTNGRLTFVLTIQNYITMSGVRYVDLGLGTHRVKCRIHTNFRLVLIAEDKDVYEKFPIPLINRLEKHYLGMETMLTEGKPKSFT